MLGLGGKGGGALMEIGMCLEVNKEERRAWWITGVAEFDSTPENKSQLKKVIRMKRPRRNPRRLHQSSSNFRRSRRPLQVQLAANPTSSNTHQASRLPSRWRSVHAECRIGEWWGEEFGFQQPTGNWVSNSHFSGRVAILSW